MVQSAEVKVQMPDYIIVGVGSIIISDHPCTMKQEGVGLCLGGSINWSFEGLWHQTVRREDRVPFTSAVLLFHQQE